MTTKATTWLAAACFVAAMPLPATAEETDGGPYELPTLRDQARDFHYVPPITHRTTIDADALFNRVVNCYPSGSWWDAELKLRATSGVQNRIGTDDAIFFLDTPEPRMRYTAGLVFDMPLFSLGDMQRVKDDEYKRRQGVAGLVSEFIAAVALRDRAQRELGLYTSLEARSQKRVKTGIADVDEQVSFLEKVIQSEEKLETAHAQLTKARLAIIGQCRADVADTMNGYLRGLSGK